MSHSLESRHWCPYVLKVSEKARLPFQLPPTVLISPSAERAPVVATIRLGLFVPQSRWFRVEPFDAKLSATAAHLSAAPEVLVLGPVLTVRVWPLEGVAALIWADDFRQRQFEANEVRRVQLPGTNPIRRALAWGKVGDRLLALGVRRDTNLEP